MSKRRLAKKRPITKRRSDARGSSRGRPGTEKRSKERIEIIARGLLAIGGRVLMCRNVRHGYAYLPGGHVEFRESAAEALEREFLEETGLTVRTKSLILVTEATFKAGTPARRHHEVNLVFHVEHAGSSPPRTDRPVRSREPDIAFDWVDPAAAPELDIRPPSAKALLASGGVGAVNGAEWISEMGG